MELRLTYDKKHTRTISTYVTNSNVGSTVCTLELLQKVYKMASMSKLFRYCLWKILKFNCTYF